MPYRSQNASADDGNVQKVPLPESPALAENMKKLMAGRSIESLRSDMAEAGYAIGTETLHRAVLGKTGNRLVSLQKIATYFGVTVDQLLQPDLGAGVSEWPFTLELYDEIALLHKEDVLSLERAMWVHLRKPLPAVLQQESREAARAAVDQLSESVSVTPATQRKRTG